MKKILMAAAAATAFVSTAAIAAVTFDPETGIGWAGKGDVQLALGYNNNQLQKGGPYSFTYGAENSWECVKVVELGNGGTNEIILERNSTTSGLLVEIARENSKGKDGPITGFYLNGWDGNVTTNGPQTGSCPNSHSGFVEGSLQTDNGGLYVNGVLLQ